MRVRRATPFLAGLIANGCALLSRGAPLTPHYYDPVMPERVTTTAASPTCALQLGDVSAEDDLGQSIAFRTSPYEVGYYEMRRWSKSPDNYLRRALVRGLFDAGPCRRILSGDAPTLDARLLAFEEQRGSPHRARVAVHVFVHDNHGVTAEATFDAARPFTAGVGDAGFDEFVAALAQALEDVVGNVIALVESTSGSAAQRKAE